MGLGDHLDELRRGLIIALLGLLPILIGGFFVGSPALAWIIAPLERQLIAAGEPAGLLATGPLESFIAYLKVSFGVSIVVGLPWLIYQAWLFVAPGLFPRERRFVYFLIPSSVVLTFLSVLFLFRVLLPISLYFLIVFGSQLATTDVPERRADDATIALLEQHRLPVLEANPPAEQLQPGTMWLNPVRNTLSVVLPQGQDDAPSATEAIDHENAAGSGAGTQPTPVRIMTLRLGSDGLIAQQYRVGEYVSLVFRLMIVFALAFQLPIVMLLLGWVGILDRRFAARYRRHVGFGCAVAGAVLTPQDPWSMILLGGVLYLLFELGLVLMRFITPDVVAGGARGRPTDANSDDEQP